jgi:two-component system, chemotaxis family, chemotaxis protein CheY
MTTTTRKQVLIVEDEPMMRQLEQSILEQAGYDVQQAEDGQVAIDWLGTARPDLVLLDVLMPRVDGWGVLEHVRKMESPPPVVLVSGMHEILPPGHLNQYVTGYVCKPFDISQLLKTCAGAIAAQPLVPAAGSRKEPRRTFLVETTLLSESGIPLAQGQLVQLSRGGFRVELGVAIEPGDSVRVAFRLPGRPDPLRLTGRVRWRSEFTLGAEIDDVAAADEKVLRELTEQG